MLDQPAVFRRDDGPDHLLFRIDREEFVGGVRHYSGVVRPESAGPDSDRPLTISTSDFHREGWQRYSRKVSGWDLSEREGV